VALGAVMVVACKPGEGKTAYVGAEVFDGTGAPLLLDAVILVGLDGRVEAIGTPDQVPIPRGATEVRLDGKWVIPGLIDAHTHAEAWTLSRFVAYGVTSVRDVGGHQQTVMNLRDQALLGGVLGPRMYVSGAVIDGPSPTRETATSVRTPTEARRAIDQLTLLEAAQAKIYTKMNRRLLRPLMDEAGVLNLPVTGHLGKVDAVTAARLGVKTLEHITGVVEAASGSPGRYYSAHDNFFRGWNLVERSWSQIDSATYERTARRLIELGVRIVPTLTLHETWAHLLDGEFTEQLDLSGMPDSIREAWDVPGLVRRAGITSADFRAFRRSRFAQDRFVRMYHRGGGIVAAGSDAPNQLLAPGVSLHDEMAMLVRAGLLPRDALLAATRNVATLLEADSIGVIRAGGVADFVVLDANPLEDIQNTKRINRVVLRGTAYTPDELREGWQ
jgi:imidazolonepropionase-like amidohydrolase